MFHTTDPHLKTTKDKDLKEINRRLTLMLEYVCHYLRDEDANDASSASYNIQDSSCKFETFLNHQFEIARERHSNTCPRLRKDDMRISDHGNR